MHLLRLTALVLLAAVAFGGTFTCKSSTGDDDFTHPPPPPPPPAQSK